MVTEIDHDRRRSAHSSAVHDIPSRTREPVCDSATAARQVVHDEDRLQLTWPATGWQRLSGRLDSGNRTVALALINDSARSGRRNLDLSALRDIDSDSLRAILASSCGLHLRRPSAAVQRMLERLAGEERDPIGARTGTAVAGFTVPTVVTSLIWRTFGQSADGARTTLDWAGLMGQQAGPIGDLARRYGTTTATLRRRVQRVSTRGANLPLTPRVLHDATRISQPTDDALGRQRCAHILGVAVPVDSTVPNRLR